MTTLQPRPSPRRSSRSSRLASQWKHEPPPLPALALTRSTPIATLEDVLGRQHASGNVLLVVGPPGYGKSTIIRQWAETGSMPVAWYQLDAADMDPMVLLSGIVGALRSKLPRAKWGIDAAISQSRQVVLTASELERMIAILVADIGANVAKPLTLVLRDVGVLPAASASIAVLDGLLARHPDRLRVVIEAREAPPLQTDALVLTHRISGVQNLRLSDDDSAVLLDLYNVHSSAEVRSRLIALCDGWITGVLLASGALLTHGMTFDAYAELDRERVFGYLARQVLDAMPEELRQFAEQVSVLDQMTAPVCAGLLNIEIGRCRRLLVACERQVGFISRKGQMPEEPRYEFAPLMRMALRERLDPHDAQALRERAAVVLTAHRDYDGALKQYESLRDYAGICALIEEQAPQLLRAGQGATVLNWIALVPLAVLEDRPALLVQSAELHRMAQQVTAADALIERAIQIVLVRHAQTDELAARVLVLRAGVRITRGEYASARVDCELAAQYADAETGDAFVHAQLYLVACYHFLGCEAAIPACLRAVEERATRQHLPWARSRAHYFHSKVLIVQGKYRAAEHQAREALKQAQEHNDVLIAINSLTNLGATLCRLGSLAAAREYATIALEQAQTAHYAVGIAYAMVTLGDIEAHSGNWATAIETFQTVRQLAADGHDTELFVHASASCGYALAQSGAASEAVALLAPLLSRADILASDDHTTVLALALGANYLQLGAFSAARTQLAAARDRATTDDAAARRARIDLHLAAALLAEQKPEQAATVLQEALTAVSADDVVAVLRFEARRLGALRPLLAASAEPGARLLLEAIDDESADATPSTQVATDTDVRVFGFGVPRAFVGLHEVTRSEWRSQRVRALFFYMLDKKRDVTDDTLVEVLYPEGDTADREDEIVAIGEKRGTNVRDMGYRLRMAFGRKCLFGSSSQRRLTLECEYDVREFERLANEATTLEKRGDLQKAVVALRGALAYYVGDYLEGMYAEWVVLRRDDLSRRHLDCLKLLADIEMRLQRWQDAEEHYKEILTLDSYDESAHRALMELYQRSGQHWRALRQFRLCQSILRDEIHAAPSRETLAVYDRLVAEMRDTAALSDTSSMSDVAR